MLLDTLYLQIYCCNCHSEIALPKDMEENADDDEEESSPESAGNLHGIYITDVLAYFTP